MSKAVVILGAGASSDFGVPTLQGIFKDKWARQYLKEDKFLDEKLNEVFWQPRGHTLETSDQSLTIEEMLTILRDWEKEPGCSEMPDPEFLKEFRHRLYVLIMRAVYEGKSTRAQHLNPLLEICNKYFSEITWASFNWDCVFDASFWYWQPRGSRSNPSLAVRIENAYGGSSKHKFLKLHGGINWWMVNDKLTYIPFAQGGELEKRWRDYASKTNTRDEPVILEPSSYKYQGPFYTLLESQWKLFFERLCKADAVIMIGYSLPEADAQARSKIMTAFNINKTCKWLLVDPSEATCFRYLRLFGHSKLTMIRTGLAGFNNDIFSNMQTAFQNVAFSELPKEPEVRSDESQ